MRNLPSAIRAEIEKGARNETTQTRSYREVNQLNRNADGMANLHSADIGFNSKLTPASAHVEEAFDELDGDMSI